MLSDKSRRVKVGAIVAGIAIVLVSLGAAASSSKAPCSREVIDGNLDGDTEFRAKDVIIYGDRMFPGNPMVVRVEGNVTTSDWYRVALPGIRIADQLRIFARGADIGAYFLDGDLLSFYVNMSGAAAIALVNIYYIPGSATWTNHYELDLDEGTLALVGHIFWNAKVLFRDIDLILVSGAIHSAPAGTYANEPQPSPAAMGGGFSLWDISPRAAPPETDSLRAFSVPSSTDTGIYVVHRAAAVDIPGSNRPGSFACSPSSFYVRVYESSVATREMVVVDGASLGSLNVSAPLPGRPQGPPLFFEIKNTGGLPWMSGPTDLYKDGILAGTDNVPYVSRNGTVRLQMGWAYDVKVTRAVETADNRTYTNYTVANLDASGYTVEIRERYSPSATSLGLFVREGSELVARVYVAAGESIALGWARDA